MPIRKDGDSFYKLVTSQDEQGNVVENGRWHDFKIRLGENATTLPGKWEVAVKSVSYTNGFSQVFGRQEVDVLWLVNDDATRDKLLRDNVNRVLVDDTIMTLYASYVKYVIVEHLAINDGRQLHRCVLRGGNYKRAEDLTNDYNAVYQNWWSAIGLHRDMDKHSWAPRLDPRNSKLSVIPGMPPRDFGDCIVMPYFPNNISEILGMPSIHSQDFRHLIGQYLKGMNSEMICTKMVDFRKRKRVLTINSDLIDSSIPRLPELRVLRILGDEYSRAYGEQVSHDFSSLIYMPVNRTVLNEIGVSLKYEGEREIDDCIKGMLAVMLHFRAVKPEPSRRIHKRSIQRSEDESDGNENVFPEQRQECSSGD